MDFIPTTATHAAKLNRLAKTRRKSTGTSLAVALDAVAKEHGYEHWKHLTACLEETKRAGATLSLPKQLQAILDEAALHEATEAETRRAFAEGFVFAMDVKDAQDIKPSPLIVPCGDGWHLAARDQWIDLVYERDFETDATLLETLDAEELLEIALDDIHNYRLFRHSNSSISFTVPEAYKLVSEMSFFAPTHMWLKGKFINLAKVPEIRVDGAVVYSTTQGRGDRFEPPKGTDAARLWHLLSDEERRIFGTMSVAAQSFMLHQAKKRTPYGESQYRPLHRSVIMPWGQGGSSGQQTES